MTTEVLPHWDVSNVYPGLESEAFVGAVREFQARVTELEEYLSAHRMERDGARPANVADLAELVSGYLERMNGAARLGGTLRSYIHAYVSTDSYNTVARRIESEFEPWLVRMTNQELRFRGWFGTAAGDPATLEQLLGETSDGTHSAVREHAFHLRETAEQSRYLMSAAEEALAAELSLSGSRAWAKLQGVVTSQLKVPFEREGRVEELPITVVQNLRSDPDEGVRRRAYEAEQAAWHGVREPLAACLNGIKGTVITLNRRRGRIDALHQPLDQARIDRETLETMLGAMRDSFPVFRRYWQAKARLLGKEVLPWWDLYAPVGGPLRRYSFAEARELILDRFGTFSERLATFARRAFEHRWIDAEPRSGKRGGAFCMSLPAVEESRVLCNFDGSLDQVLTLAHELGHAYHNECQVGKLPLQRRTPMTLAETASIFNETIVIDAILVGAADAAEELAVLETFLLGASQVIVDIYSRFLFEREVFERRAGAELSADDLCQIMTRAQQETYGEGLDGRALNPYMWAWKPHYYNAELSFYNFPYAFGLLFGLGLYAVHREQGTAFLPAYDELLRSTGEARAAELAACFRIDLRQRAFWEDSLQVIRQRIERYQTLAEKEAPL